MSFGRMCSWISGEAVPCTGGDWESVCEPELVPAWQWLLPRVLERAARCSGASVAGPGLVFVGTIGLGQQVTAWLQGRLLALGACRTWAEARLRVVLVSSQETSAGRRREIAADLDAGKVWVAVATRCWSTGVDIPALRWVSLDPGVGAPQSVVQSAGRGARIAGGPEFEILMAPGPHQERQIAALTGAGYRRADGSGVYRAVVETNKEEPMKKESQPQGSIKIPLQVVARNGVSERRSTEFLEIPISTAPLSRVARAKAESFDPLTDKTYAGLRQVEDARWSGLRVGLMTGFLLAGLVLAALLSSGWLSLTWR